MFVIRTYSILILTGAWRRSDRYSTGCQVVITITSSFNRSTIMVYCLVPLPKPRALHTNTFLAMKW